MKLGGAFIMYDELKRICEELGTSQNRKIYINHGNDLNQYGISIKNLKILYKKYKNEDFGKELFYSENSDLIYLSSWFLDMKQLELSDILYMIDLTNYYLILEYVLPSIMIKDLDFSILFIKKYIDSEFPKLRQVSYSLYGLYVSVVDDASLDMKHILDTLNHIKVELKHEFNRVKYTMNNFLIASGVYIKGLQELVLDISFEIGEFSVDMGKTACKIPSVETYIQKNRDRNKIGVKRKL